MLSLETTKWVNTVAEKIEDKMKWMSDQIDDKIPSRCVTDHYDDKKTAIPKTIADGINCWTNGFWPGMLWLTYNETKIEKYREIAERIEGDLDICFEQYYGLHHDVGFMWLYSSVENYRITENEVSKKRALHAANLLAGRFNPVGKFIRAWNDIKDEDATGWAIIDCMMNIPLLYWATEETNDPRFKHIAIMHADTVMESFIREDGSSEHIVGFDPWTGEKVKTYRGQGYALGSSWTRGQAWALYGFILSYKYTQKIEYLDMAKRIAYYFMANIPENGIIPIDFKQANDSMREDSSAATIAASGLIDIAIALDGNDNQIYLEKAIKLLRTLDEERCDWSKNKEGIVTRCSGSYHSDLEYMSLIYGDYYFMEAMYKLKNISKQ
ncbi:glycoside hydrolase family 88 protein [Vallitaleaceae bacterium 9-2]